MRPDPIHADEAIEVALDRAQEVNDYGLPLRRRILEELPRMRLAGRWLGGKRQSLTGPVLEVRQSSTKRKLTGSEKRWQWFYVGYEGGGTAPSGWAVSAQEAQTAGDKVARADGWLLWDPPLDRLAARLTEIGAPVSFVDYLTQGASPRTRLPAVWSGYGTDEGVRKLLAELGWAEPTVADGLGLALTHAQDNDSVVVWYIVENKRQLMRAHEALLAERAVRVEMEGCYRVNLGGGRESFLRVTRPDAPFHVLGYANHCVVGCKIPQKLAEELRRRCTSIVFTEGT